MNMTPQDRTLLAAIDSGNPVAGNRQQAAELIAAENREAANAARRVAGLIECRECGKIGQQGRMSSGHLIQICVACKAKADAQANGLATAVSAAFAPLAKFPPATKDPKAVAWARTQLDNAGSTDALSRASDGALVEWLDDIYRTLKTGRYPSWMLEAESHECPTCEIDCAISEEADGPSDTAKDVPCATCPLCERRWFMSRGEWESQ